MTKTTIHLISFPMIATSESMRWLSGLGNTAVSSRQIKAAPHVLRESLLWGVPMMVLAVIACNAVIYRCQSYREKFTENRIASAFDELLKTRPPLETERHRESDALRAQLEHLWKSAFVIFVAVSTRIATLRRKGSLRTWRDIHSDRLTVFLLALFLFLVGSWAIHCVGLHLAKEDPFNILGMEPTHDLKEIRVAYWRWYKSIRLGGE